ncbi:MAG: Ig-like domain-containing protein, partial [Blastocatellia bacterium]
TLAWTDAPGSPMAGPIVNDLDLQVSQGGQNYLGNNFLGGTSLPGGNPDKLNNVEGVWLNPGHDGEVVITVVAANLSGDGVPGNSNPIDQDFALVVYNTVPDDGSIDSPPTVTLTYPVGGENVAAGGFANIQWSAADDHGIQSQEVQLSTDSGVTFERIAQLDAAARNFAWQVPQISTTEARIEIRAFDGANLPVSAVSQSDFSIENGPPDTIPPQVQLLSPSAGAPIGGGTSLAITWQESDNVGVVKRVIEFSPDAGNTYQPVATITGPIFTAGPQNYQWQVPASLSATKGRLRMTVYDGAGNSAQSASGGKIKVWALPMISNVTYRTLSNGQGELVVAGANFREGQAQVYVNETALGNLTFQAEASDRTFNKIISDDKKLKKEIPAGAAVNVSVRVAMTGQISATFHFVRGG